MNDGNEDHDYRFGFNGKEMDNETYGTGNEYDYGFRIYNPRLGRFLSVDPLAQSYPTFSPYHFAGNSPIKFSDIDGLEMYIKGTVADAFMNMLSQNTGLGLARESATGLLTYATQTVVNPSNGTEYSVPVVNKSTGNEISTTLRETVIKAINGGNGIDPVTIIAMKRSEIKAASGRDNVLFDQPPSNIATPDVNLPNSVDMGDFAGISQESTLQSAMSAHIIGERMNASQGWDAAHNAGLSAELGVIQEKYPSATIRNENNMNVHLQATSGVFEEISKGKVFDYGAVKYTTFMKNSNNGVTNQLNPNEVVGVSKQEKK